MEHPVLVVGPRTARLLLDVVAGFFGAYLILLSLFGAGLWLFSNSRDVSVLGVLLLAAFVIPLGLQAQLLLFRAVRRVEVNHEFITLRSAFGKRVSMNMADVLGFSACQWAMVGDQGIVLNTRQGRRYEVMDYASGDLAPLVAILKQASIPYLGEEIIWLPYIRTRHSLHPTR